VVVAGATTLILSIGTEGAQNVNLTSYGLSFPFYDVNYNNFWVNENGLVTFTSANGDFTPTPADLHSGQPKICPQWTDLSTSYGGNIRVIINQASTIPQPIIRVEWNNLAEWQNTGGIHTFYLEMFPWSGDMTFIYHPFNNAMIYDEMAGIAPGNNQYATGSTTMSVQKNLSNMAAVPVNGAPRESFWEWFGLTGGQMPYYQPVPYLSNPFDLTGSTVTFYGVGLGVTGGYYIGS
jgi:hypothetical protein